MIEKSSNMVGCTVLIAI